MHTSTADDFIWVWQVDAKTAFRSGIQSLESGDWPEASSHFRAAMHASNDSKQTQSSAHYLAAVLLLDAGVWPKSPLSSSPKPLSNLRTPASRGRHFSSDKLFAFQPSVYCFTTRNSHDTRQSGSGLLTPMLADLSSQQGPCGDSKVCISSVIWKSKLKAVVGCRVMRRPGMHASHALQLHFPFRTDTSGLWCSKLLRGTWSLATLGKFLTHQQFCETSHTNPYSSFVKRCLLRM